MGDLQFMGRPPAGGRAARQLKQFAAGAELKQFFLFELDFFRQAEGVEIFSEPKEFLQILRDVFPRQADQAVQRGGGLFVTLNQSRPCQAR